MGAVRGEDGARLRPGGKGGRRAGGEWERGLQRPVRPWGGEGRRRAAQSWWDGARPARRGRGLRSKPRGTPSGLRRPGRFSNGMGERPGLGALPMERGRGRLSLSRPAEAAARPRFRSLAARGARRRPPSVTGSGTSCLCKAGSRRATRLPLGRRQLGSATLQPSAAPRYPVTAL